VKRFYIDESYIQQLGLHGNELLVFAALQAKCAIASHRAQQSNLSGVSISFSELSRISGCGSHDTAARSVASLLRRGLITQINGQYGIAQNALSVTQNASVPKERTKEKGYNKNNNEIFTRNYSLSPPATEQQQAHYAGSQYAAYQRRKQLEAEREKRINANEETKYVTFDDYKKAKPMIS